MRAALPPGCVGAALRPGWDDVIEHTRVALPSVVAEVQWCDWPRVELEQKRRHGGGAPRHLRGEHLSLSAAPEIPEHSACWQRHKAAVVWDGVEWCCTQPGCMKRIAPNGPRQRDEGPLPYELSAVRADEWYAESVRAWGDPVRRRRCLSGRHEGKPWTRALPIPEGPRPR